MFLTILIIIFGFSFLIIAHELGHFLVAKWAGMKVEEFGMGFPPKIFSYKSKKDGTVYSINWIPFGAFVRIKGEDEVLEKGQKPQQDSFGGKSVLKRMAVIVAGVVMNFLAAILILTLLNAMGTPSEIEDDNAIAKNPQVQISGVNENSPAKISGLKVGDIIKEIKIGSDVINVNKVSEAQSVIGQNKGKEIAIIISSEGEEKEIKTTPRENPPEGEGALGIGLVRTGIIKIIWYKAPVEAAKGSWYIIKLTFIFLRDMAVKFFTRGKIPEVSGPVGIVTESVKISRMGRSYTFWILALISLNLFLINLLPLPALDGGRLLFLIIEGIKGSPVSQKLEQKVHMVGFFVLIALMLLVTARDIQRLILGLMHR